MKRPFAFGIFGRFVACEAPLAAAPSASATSSTTETVIVRRRNAMCTISFVPVSITRAAARLPANARVFRPARPAFLHRRGRLVMYRQKLDLKCSISR
jgi:hypothetical protein